MPITDVDCLTAAPILPEKNSKPSADGPYKVLPPWSTPPIKLYRPGQRCLLSECANLGELWDWVKETDRDKRIACRCEYISDEACYRGVALSRFAQSIEGLCGEFVLNKKNWAALLNPDVYEGLYKEIEGLLPHLKVLNGAGLPSKLSSKLDGSLGSIDKHLWKDSGDVKKAVSYVLEWMSNSGTSVLRATMSLTSACGLSYDALVNHLLLKAYIEEGGGKDRLLDDATARLCQGGTRKREREPEDLTGVLSAKRLA